MFDVSDDGSEAGDNELKQALLAAFGDDALDLLDADDHDDFPAGSAQDPWLFPGLVPDESDSPKVRWAKELYRGIYTDTPAIRAGNTTPAIDRRGDSDSAPSAIRCLLFSIGKQTLAIPLSSVQEIVRHPRITELPRTAAWLRGVTSLRGGILSVTDLRSLFGLNDPRPDSVDRMIVIHSRDRTIATGLMVDQINGIRLTTVIEQNKPGEDQDSTGWMTEFAGDWIRFDDSTAVLIDAEKLLRCEELTVYT